MGETGRDISIHIEKVRHVYKGGNAAINGIDLDIHTGLFGMLGPNGAGKSTLMRIICSLLVPTEGHVIVGGYDVVKERRHVRRMLGYLPQDFNAWRLHRVEEVLETLAILSGLENNIDRKSRVEEILTLVGLLEVSHRKVKSLSGGMVRRLGVAQALIHDPKVLIVDEPTVGLDPEERIHFRQLMAKMGKERIIILSTHIVGDLGAGCHDLALIDRGRLKFRGSPEELIAHAKGAVFEMHLEGNRAELSDQYEIVSQEVKLGRTIIRAVSKMGSIPDGAVPVDNPTLEEAYLAFMASKSVKEAAKGGGA
ncbi:MAG: ATP-binding cassette domain-containing protein [Desulfatiglans sp.]|jgi:ABC-type multidrug transport system ATPase subunit|nr:ATP-binding cassette domain-containing protein [Desulfatiglans sp.]